MKTLSQLLPALFLRQVQAQNGRVFIIGTNDVARSMARYLAGQGRPVTALVDFERSGELDGIPIESLPILGAAKPTDLIAIADPDISRERQIALQRTVERFHFFAYRRTFELEPLTTAELAKITRSESLYKDDWLSRKVLGAALEMRLSGNYAAAMTVKTLPQYFDQTIFRLSDHEIFVDGGAFTGDTIDQLNLITRGCFDHCYSFEPDTRNFELLTASIAKSQNRDIIEAIPMGLYSSAREVTFHQSIVRGHGSSRIRDDGGHAIQTTTLDDFLGGRRVTFIKLDIEGAEQEALRGATDTMRTHKPKLAVCVYHRFEHIWEIPLFLADTLQGYEFFLRHHSENAWETVLYARPSAMPSDAQLSFDVMDR